MAKKKSTSKASKAKAALPVRISRSRNVNIEKASNGFVISSFGDKGQTTVIAKTKAEAKKAADKLLGL